MLNTKYVLSNNLPDSARLMGLQDYIFQQDNYPKHAAKLYFKSKQFKLLSWPAQSPDLNPIEGYYKAKIITISPQKFK